MIDKKEGFTLFFLYNGVMKNILFLILLIFLPSCVYAQEYEEVHKGTVNEIFEVECSEVLDSGYTCFEYSVRVDGKENAIRSIPIMSETGESRFHVARWRHGPQ